VLDMESLRKKTNVVGAIYGFDAVCILLFGVVLKWI
jgi:hypothetical protein